MLCYNRAMADHYTFLKHVFPAELKSIRARWEQNKRRTVPEAAGDSPSQHQTPSGGAGTLGRRNPFCDF
jgi:hypothetical protein